MIVYEYETHTNPTYGSPLFAVANRIFIPKAGPVVNSYFYQFLPNLIKLQVF